MQRLKRLYGFLDMNCAPSCSKQFMKDILRANGKLKMTPKAFRNGNGSRVPLELGLVCQEDDNSIHYTDFALEMVD